jgi:aldose sugar dehydrogenase
MPTGIRNGFGLSFDPVTGKLWDTENGPDYGDEINLVEPGFNSGWVKYQGVWKSNRTNAEDVVGQNPERLLEDFNGKGKYSPPEFTWNETVGVTDITITNSDKLGKDYENDMFVADFHNGYIYHFDLNKERTELVLNGPLNDKIANNRDELKKVIFAQGFDGITDLEIGPDGFLYVASSHQDKIFRIIPKHLELGEK